MSKFTKLFKGSSSSSSSSSSKSRHHHRSHAGPTPQEAIHKLRETEEMLTKKQDFLEKRIEQELMTAKKHGTKNKQAALRALKKKKRLEQQLVQIDGTLSTIEFQREALENSHTNTEVLKNMGFAARALEKVHKDINIDKIDDMMQDITEQQDRAQEISDAISRPFGDVYDEDELLAELQELQDQDMEESMESMGGLPSVPSSKLPSARPSQHASTRRRAEEDEDLSKLASWAI
ncbi:charged multivesicular body protein 4c [Takifugu rubripes]|uniref:Charged multivesicular body protein 4C n=1 Tax=Takifugu rubripes TaxID=31033 RepID=H2TAQ3_TAKRU|nr:charged multivesicular body protein 4c-like [Takifugu rubripes]|eukprot:XP_003968110.1 PREDICTED: charged multivesicular body protein 4c-like [Takifugu rubripes]